MMCLDHEMINTDDLHELCYYNIIPPDIQADCTTCRFTECPDKPLNIRKEDSYDTEEYKPGDQQDS